MPNNTGIELEVRQIIARFKGKDWSADQVAGSMRLATPPLGFDIYKAKALKGPINEEVLDDANLVDPTGPKGPRLTYKKLEELHGQNKRVRDLETEVKRLAREIESANS